MVYEHLKALHSLLSQYALCSDVHLQTKDQDASCAGGTA
jgi:hypothetical protein